MSLWTQIDQFLKQRIWENRIENILWCVGILVFGLLLKRALSIFFSGALFRLVKKESENLPLKEFVRLVRKPVEMLITLVILYTAFSFLRFPAEWHLAPIKQFGLRRFLLKSYQVLMIIA